jgi:hypothetical protein
MEISETGGEEARIAALEKKLREMEALVKGLIDELLDFKAIAMTMSRQNSEHSSQELTREPVVQGTSFPALAGSSESPSFAVPSDGCIVIRHGDLLQPDSPVAPAEPKMARIMQSDGTMKFEVRYGDKNPIDSSAGYGSMRKNMSARSRQNPLIYAVEKDKPAPAKVNGA